MLSFKYLTRNGGKWQVGIEEFLAEIFILRNVNTPTLRLEILTFLVELLPEGYPHIYVGEEFI